VSGTAAPLPDAVAVIQDAVSRKRPPDRHIAPASGTHGPIGPGVTRPILFDARSTNQSAPSGPGVIPHGSLPAASGNSVTTPAV
jgi:hypothetical protein